MGGAKHSLEKWGPATMVPAPMLVLNYSGLADGLHLRASKLIMINHSLILVSLVEVVFALFARPRFLLRAVIYNQCM